MGRVDSVEALLSNCADKSELDTVSQNVDEVCSKVKADIEAHSDHNVIRYSDLEHRVEFLESKVCESVDVTTKEIDVCAAVAQQQLDLAARLSEKTKKLRNSISVKDSKRRMSLPTPTPEQHPSEAEDTKKRMSLP